MDTSDDSEDSVDTSERQLETELICECEKIHRMNEDDDEEETSFSRATDDICWVNMRRLGVSTKCSSDDLETVVIADDDVMTLCYDHIDAVRKHHCCWDCLNQVVTGTFLECPSGHRTDPLCRKLRARIDEGSPRSCSHCGSVDLQARQIKLHLEDSDESYVTEFTKIVEALEQAREGGVELPRSTIEHWRERMRAVAPDVLIAFRHSPQRIGDLAARMHPLLILIENEEHELIEKLVDLHGVAKSGDLVPSVATAIESISFKGELPFQYSDVVTDPDNLTRIKDEKAIMFCDCKDVCVPETCCCCTGDYEVDSEGETIIRPESLNSRMNAISECGPACACRIDCGNRLVQSRGKNYQLELTHTRDRGVGVLAKEKIPAGRFIIEYTGSVRELNNTDVTSDYRFETILGLKRVEIDSLHTGSAARCFNHCCTPNTVIVQVAWEPVEERRLFHLAIFALEDIDEGKEITIDYGDKFWNAKIDELACLCGSDGCKHNEAARQLKLEERRLQEAENEESDEDEEHDGDTDLGNADGQDDEECIEDEDSIDVEESGDEEDEDEEEIVEVHFARVEEVMVNYLVEEYVEVDEEDDEDVNVDDITEPPTSERDEVNVEDE